MVVLREVDLHPEFDQPKTRNWGTSFPSAAGRVHSREAFTWGRPPNQAHHVVDIAAGHPYHEEPMDYEWDNAKAESNERKHGIDFFEAIVALQDPLRIDEPDDGDYGSEVRFQIIGIADGRVLFVVSTLRGRDVCRIISARKATRYEQDKYYTSNR